MPLVVHHYYPFGSENVGDHMVARAIRQAIPRHFGPCAFVDMPINDRYKAGDRTLGLLGDNLEKTNAEADLVIIGGSNLLEPRKARREGFFGRIGKWSIFTDARSIKSLQPPLLLLGMGTGSSFGKHIRRFEKPALDEVRLLHEKSFASAVRDVTTVREMKRIGVHTQCTGCPVTFLTDRPVRAGRDNQPLMVSFPPIGITAKPFGKSFIRQSIQYMHWLHGKGVPMVVTLHDSRDREPAKKLVPSGVEIFYTADLDEQIARFENSRGVIGFRLHAALLGLALGKPIIPVGLDWRGLAFIETFEAWDLSIRPLRLGQFSKLKELTERLLQNDADMLRRLDEKKTHFRMLFERFLAGAASQFRQITEGRSVAIAERNTGITPVSEEIQHGRDAHAT